MDASSLVSHFGMSPEEESQFRLNLENKAYASAVFDDVTYFALFNPDFRRDAELLLTRDIGGAPDNELLQLVHKPGGEALVVLAAIAGAVPNDAVGPLGYAIRTGSVSLVSLLLDLGADPNSLSASFCFAVQKGYYSIVELLVRRGLQVNRVIWNITPLGCAAEEGDCQFVNFFLDHGADPNFVHESELSYFRMPLEICIHRRDRTCLELLLQRGADPNAYDKRGFDSPFMLALRCEDPSFAQVLLLYGADWRTCDTRLVSKLLFKRFEWFVENSGYAPNVPAPEGRSLLELVTSLGEQDKIKLLVERGALPPL